MSWNVDLPLEAEKERLINDFRKTNPQLFEMYQKLILIAPPKQNCDLEIIIKEDDTGAY
jgi:hypothetical protein